MSRSFKDGRHGGAHENYAHGVCVRRVGSWGTVEHAQAGKAFVKRQTSRLRRRESRHIVLDEVRMHEIEVQDEMVKLWEWEAANDFYDPFVSFDDEPEPLDYGWYDDPYPVAFDPIDELWLTD